MSRLLRAELLKIRTVRTFLWIALANVALVLITVVGVAASEDPIQTPEDDRAAAQIAGIAIVLALIAGIVVTGGEAKYGTITQTLLVTPVRERVLLTKAAVAALIGLALALLSEALVLAITVPTVGLDIDNARLTLLGILIAGALAGALGAGIGAVVHAQGGAITISLVWLLVGENLTPVISESATKYTPGRTFAALASGDRTGVEVLGMGAGGVMAGAWTVLFVGTGLLAFLGRDV
jgi:ABC-type transport system involved in multi-copper enzyme maturation permease subunit